MTDTLTKLADANAKLDKRRRQLREALAAAERAAKAHELASKPPTPIEPGRSGVDPTRSYMNYGTAVVTFTKNFGGSGEYHYAAIRPKGYSQWVITTASSAMTHGRKYTWAELMEFVAEKEKDQGRKQLATVQEWIQKW